MRIKERCYGLHKTCRRREAEQPYVSIRGNLTKISVGMTQEQGQGESSLASRDTGPDDQHSVVFIIRKLKELMIHKLQEMKHDSAGVRDSPVGVYRVLNRDAGAAPPTISDTPGHKRSVILICIRGPVREDGSTTANNCKRDY
jgi:hypothetical protein